MIQICASAELPVTMPWAHSFWNEETKKVEPPLRKSLSCSNLEVPFQMGGRHRQEWTQSWAQAWEGMPGLPEILRLCHAPGDADVAALSWKTAWCSAAGSSDLALARPGL